MTPAPAAAFMDSSAGIPVSAASPFTPGNGSNGGQFLGDVGGPGATAVVGGGGAAVVVGGTVVDVVVVELVDVVAVVVVLDDAGAGGAVVVTGVAAGSEVQPAATTAPRTAMSKAERHAATPTRGMTTPYDRAGDESARRRIAARGTALQTGRYQRAMRPDT